ncbi:hypothetical protein AMECASPLE_031827 [Ameca splendens]|uniref:tRNA pseudouridine38/39 synthase n=1 Tax=Ameca splendens TaxID=208324 RepID=A0ABV0Y6B4_9TELE
MLARTRTAACLLQQAKDLLESGVLSETYRHKRNLNSYIYQSSMSGALLQRIKELEDELEKLRSQFKESTRPAEDMEMKSCSPASESLNCITSDGNTRSTKKSGKERHFDFGSHPRRHVALKLAYLGWAYQGFAVQENTDNTVEARLFEALLKTRLIQDRQSSNYHRCGRTDKGVSAFSQVTQSCGRLLN